MSAAADERSRRSTAIFCTMVSSKANPSAKTVPAGLCDRCTHAERIQSDRGTVYIRCALARVNPAFAKYPRLPVLQCEGYEEMKLSSGQE